MLVGEYYETIRKSFALIILILVNLLLIVSFILSDNILQMIVTRDVRKKSPRKKFSRERSGVGLGLG